MAKRIFALLAAIAIGLLGACAVALTPGCAWWQKNEPVVGAFTYGACILLLQTEGVVGGEADMICSAAQSFEDVSRLLARRSARMGACPAVQVDGGAHD